MEIKNPSADQQNQQNPQKTTTHRDDFFSVSRTVKILMAEVQERTAQATKQIHILFFPEMTTPGD